MNDFEKRLSDALKNATDSYSPSDPYAAKERFLHRLRRRRLVFYSAGTALAGAAAALAFVLIPGRVSPPEPQPLPAAAEVEEKDTIDVGERPSGVAFGDDSVWVANSGDGTVMVIDPVRREVIETVEVGGDPDDVAVGVGAAWASDSGAGTITRIPLPSSGDEMVASEPISVGEPDSTHMDVAPGAGALWIAKDDSLFRLDPATLQAEPINSGVTSPTDVAVGEGSVYVLGESQLARIDPVSFDPEPLTDVTPSENQDLAFREGFVWIANGDAGEVTRFDPVTRKPSAPIYVGGNFSGIAVDETAVWVISGGTSEVGVLTRISPDALTVVEPRGQLSGRPYDITLGAGAVWIANQSAATVTAVDPNALPQPTEGQQERDIAFVFAADGDIWAETMDGETIPLVRTPDATEADPTLSPDGRLLAFVRATDEKTDHIVIRELESGAEESGERGGSPVFGPDGRLAFVSALDEDDHVEIVVRTLSGTAVENEVRFDPIRNAPRSMALVAGDLAWDLDGTYLYYNAGLREGLDHERSAEQLVTEPLGLYQADAAGETAPFELVPGNHRSGATYLSPSVRSDSSVHVVRTCCDPTPSDLETDLGIIRFTEGGTEYESIASLDALGLAAGDFVTGGAIDSAGNLTLEGTGNARRWRHTVVRSWFVTTTRHIWLLPAQGDPILVSEALGRIGRLDGLETAPDKDD